jgi:hypothetical protein
MSLEPRSFLQKIAPAIVLMVLAPLIAEVLPGSTRMSSIFVFPIEMGVWGGGALLVREATRRWNLGWLNMLLLSFVLALAEECLIQQSSLAPLVFSIQKGGELYARAAGINYLYLLWALGYESVFVVFLPVAVAELIFSDRRRAPWLGRAGLAGTLVYFLIACFFAWFTWTQIARVKVFHVPAYHPPLLTIMIAVMIMAALVLLVLGPARQRFATRPLQTCLPSHWIVGVTAFALALLWYGLVVLAFGARPHFPPAIAVASGLIMAVLALCLFPRWSAASGWNETYRFTVAASAIVASMLVGFVGFIGASAMDFYGKLIADIVAAILLFWLGAVVIRRARLAGGQQEQK